MKIRNKKGQWIKGFSPWNKGTKGVMKPNKTSFKKGDGFIPIEQRFWKYVKKTNTCWEWIGGINKAGYGRISQKPKVFLAHRYSFVLHKGDIPKYQFVLHSCDNPKCVNPEHLRLGGYQENCDDMYARGRAVLGENRSQAKLTNKEAEEIREFYRSGNYSHRKLAEKYKVSSAVIFNIIHNKTYHIWP